MNGGWIYDYLSLRRAFRWKELGLGLGHIMLAVSLELKSRLVNAFFISILVKVYGTQLHFFKVNSLLLEISDTGPSRVAKCQGLLQILYHIGTSSGYVEFNCHESKLQHEVAKYLLPAFSW